MVTGEGVLDVHVCGWIWMEVGWGGDAGDLWDITVRLRGSVSEK